MPTTYGNDIVYCLKSHCGVRGYCRQKWVLQVQIICKFSNERTCKRNKDVQGLSCGFEVEEAIKRKCNIIIEGTMRNPDVPLKTAQKFKDAGFRVEAYIIAAPKEFTQLGLYNRYQEEVLSKGQGRLADIDSHNKAVNGLMKSANQLYSDKAVDKISIHTYLAKERIKDFNLVNGEWSCKSMPSIFIDESRSKQMKNKEILNTNIQRGKELIESVTNPEVKKGMKEALSQLQSSLEKVQRQEKGLKKGFF